MNIKNRLIILTFAIVSALVSSNCERNELYDDAKNNILSIIQNTPPIFTYYLVVLGNNTNRTSKYDPEINTFSAGPNLTGNVGTGGHNFLITSGPRAGQRIVIHGGGTNSTSIYDPSTQAFSPGPPIPGPGLSYGGNSFEVTGGPYNGHRIIVSANGSSFVKRYDPNLNSFIDDGWSLTGGAASGSLNFSISGGRNIIVHGNFTLQTSIFDQTQLPLNPFITGPPVTTAAFNEGSLVYPITGGPGAGNLMVQRGANTWWINIFDTTLNDFASASLVFAGVGPFIGANNFLIPSGANAGDQAIIIGGGSSLVAIFKQSDNTFAWGPSLSGASGAYEGSTSFYIADGLQAGKVLVIHGGTTNLTSIYDPPNNSFSAGPILFNIAGWGTNVFPL